MKLRDGMIVSGKIEDVVIDRGMIRKVGNRFFFCQNVKAGATTTGDRGGYKYLWRFFIEDDGTYTNGVSDLKVLSLTNIEDIYVGAVIFKDGYEKKVLGNCHEVWFLSCSGKFNAFGYCLTIEEIKDGGWKLRPVEEPLQDVILTMGEIADKFGVDVEKLKIEKGE